MVRRPLSEPRRPCLIVSATVSTEVDSPRMQWSNVSPLARAQSTSLTVPLIATSSSSPVMRKLIEPPNAPLAMKRKAAATEAATPPFMSQAPRPQSSPSAISPENGSKRQSVLPRGAETRIKVEDRGRPRRLERDEFGAEPGLAQEIAQVRQRAGVGRRHRGKPDERARDLERRRGGGHTGALGGASTAAAFRAPARPNRGRRRRSAARCSTEDSTNRSADCASP